MAQLRSITPILTVTITLPIVLVVVAARLVMTPQFLHWEYTRAGFPADRYGFTTEDRLHYGALGVQFLLERQPISVLAEQRLPGERCFPPQAQPCPMFNERELRHMVDVQQVTSGAFTLAGGAGALLAGTASYLIAQRRLWTLLQALEWACIVFLSAIIFIALTVVLAWDVFFDTFHALFFEDGTWRFFYSDTLIRLYPEQFWMDASVVLGGIATALAVVIWLGVCWLRRSTLGAQRL